MYSVYHSVPGVEEDAIVVAGVASLPEVRRMVRKMNEELTAKRGAPLKAPFEYYYVWSKTCRAGLGLDYSMEEATA